MRLRSIVLCAALTASVSASENATRGMNPEDFYAVRSIADPRISPDGKLVAFSITTIDQKRNRRESSVWLAHTDSGSAPWRFTTGESATHPRWSPDSKSLAFISARTTSDDAPGAAAPKPQVYVLSMSGGEAVRQTTLADGVTDYEWSPDGRHLACVSRTQPGKAEPPSDFRVYRSAIYKFDGAGWYGDKRSHIWVVDLETKAVKQITRDEKRDDSEPQWSPDSHKIAFISQDVDQYPGLGGSVVITDVTSPASVVLSNQNGLAHAPRWSPDGKRVAYISSPNDSDDASIWIASTDGHGHSELASKTLNVVPTDLDWGRSKEELIFTAWSAGDQQLFRMNLSSGAVTPLTTGNRAITHVDVSAEQNKIAYVESNPTRLNEVFISDLDGKQTRQLSSVNRELSEGLLLSDVERFRYPAADGFSVEGFLMKPVGWQQGKTYPMVLMIHGGPGGMWDTEFYPEFQMMAARGYAVLFINPRGSSGYGEKFQRAVEKQWGGKTYDDLMRGVDYAVNKCPWIDRERLGVRGGSFGGFMTNWIVGHTNRFKAAVTASSISDFVSLEGTRDMAYSHAKDFGGDLFQNFDFYWNQSPLKYAANVKTPVLVMHGDADQRVPIEQGEQWFRALQHYGVPSEFVVFPRENHKMAVEPRHRIEFWQWEIYWFERYLSGNESWARPK